MAQDVAAPTLEGVYDIAGLRDLLESIGPDPAAIARLVREEKERPSVRVAFLQVLQEAQAEADLAEPTDGDAPDSARNHPTVDVPEIRMLDPEDLSPWEGLNPRRDFNEEAQEELEASIRQDGVRQPLLVHDAGADGFWIVAGERRWRAARELGVRVPCLIRTYTVEEALRIALIENVQRRDLSPVEEARGFQRYLDESGRSQRELAKEIGRSQGWIGNRLRLLKLSDEILGLIDSGTLPHSVARDLILPFSSLEPGIWEKICKEVATKLQAAKTKGGELEPDEVWDTVREVAGPLSKPLQERKGKLYPNTIVWGFDGHLGVVPTHADHKEGCDCGAPGWFWDAYRGSSRGRRCFNPTWWKAALDAAKQELVERKDVQEEVAEEPPTSLEDWPDRSKPLTRRDLMRLGAQPAPVQLHHWPTDASILPPESLYWMIGWDGPELVCLDGDALSRAREAGEAELIRRWEKAAHERSREDRDQLRGGKLDRDLWLEGLSLVLARPHVLHSVIREFGASPPSCWSHETATAWLKEHDVGLRELEEAFQIVAMRADRGDIDEDGDDLLFMDIRTAFLEEQKEAMRELIPDPVVQEPESEGGDP